MVARAQPMRMGTSFTGANSGSGVATSAGLAGQPPGVAGFSGGHHPRGEPTQYSPAPEPTGGRTGDGDEVRVAGSGAADGVEQLAFGRREHRKILRG